jgi:RNase adapter protein RapZ
MSLQELVVVTGMSGSGKGTVLKAFEDLGFFCIDNLPIPLIPKFIEGIHVSGGVVERAALVIDIRAGERLRDLEKVIATLREFEFRLFVLYLEARDEVLLRRFSETRRPHPLVGTKSLSEAIRLERRRMRSIREYANVIIDTSNYSIHEVKGLVMERFRDQPHDAKLIVYLVSFGYKHGVPLESDLLFDVRFLPNPFFVSGLRMLSGRNREVAKYLRSFEETTQLLTRITDFLKFLIPLYVKEGKAYLTVGIGCTGGRHRSVFVVQELSRLLKIRGVTIKVRHRDESQGRLVQSST